jgi:hypothetical protein
MKDWRNNALDANSGFVLKDGICAVRNVLMGTPDTTARDPQAVTRRRSDHILVFHMYSASLQQQSLAARF